ncbi:MAG: glycosyltransferase family 2 protein [Acidimicrobiales bacterium]
MALVSDVLHEPCATRHVTVSLCILVHDRPTELAEALASGDDQPWDEVIVLDMASDPPIPPSPGVRWLRSDANVGVTAGRNRLAQEASGDILVFLDDDAVFLTPAVERLRAAFGADEALGAVAFRVRRAVGAVASLEHPFRGAGSESARATPSECTYFVGCGYAMRRDAHLAAGGYDDRFFYSTEEVDLSFRLLRDGWRLEYDPSIEVEHRPSHRGRDGSFSVPGWRLRNRLLLVRAHLPMPVAAAHALVWSSRTGIEALRQRSVSNWWRLGREGLVLPVDRRPLPWRSLLRIHRQGGRVLY